MESSVMALSDPAWRVLVVAPVMAALPLVMAKIEAMCGEGESPEP